MHEERLGQTVALAAGGDGVLLHDFQQRGLGLGRGAVDLVHQQDVLEHGAALEVQHATAVRILVHDVRAENVRRHEVRRALHAARLEANDLRKHTHEEGLAEAGHAFEQDVAAAEDGDERVREEIVVAHDGLLDLRP